MDNSNFTAINLLQANHCFKVHNTQFQISDKIFLFHFMPTYCLILIQSALIPFQYQFPTGRGRQLQRPQMGEGRLKAIVKPIFCEKLLQNKRIRSRRASLAPSFGSANVFSQKVNSASLLWATTHAWRCILSGAFEICLMHAMSITSHKSLLSLVSRVMDWLPCKRLFWDLAKQVNKMT